MAFENEEQTFSAVTWAGDSPSEARTRKNKMAKFDLLRAKSAFTFRKDDEPDSPTIDPFISRICRQSVARPKSSSPKTEVQPKKEKKPDDVVYELKKFIEKVAKSGADSTATDECKSPPAKIGTPVVVAEENDSFLDDSDADRFFASINFEELTRSQKNPATSRGIPLKRAATYSEAQSEHRAQRSANPVCAGGNAAAVANTSDGRKKIGRNLSMIFAQMDEDNSDDEAFWSDPRVLEMTRKL